MAAADFRSDSLCTNALPMRVGEDPSLLGTVAPANALGLRDVNSPVAWSR